MKKTDKDRIVNILAASLLAALLLSLSFFRAFESFELNTFDFRYRLRGSRRVSENIVIIEIGDDSIKKINHWPFPRNYHALLVRALNSAGAEAVIFDVFFSEPTDDDEEFARAIADHGRVYLPYVFDIDRATSDSKQVYAKGYSANKLDSLYGQAYGTGFANVIPDSDGKVRRIPLFISYSGEKYPLVSFNAALHAKGKGFDEIEIFPGKNVKISGELNIPLDERSYLLVNYPGRWGEGFRHFSYADVLQSYLADVTGHPAIIDLSKLEGSVCFVGVTASASPDAHPSPIENMYPGVGVHASVYDSVLREAFLRRLGRLGNMIFLIILLSLTVFITRRTRKILAAIFLVGVILGYKVLVCLAFCFYGVWLDLFYPVVAVFMVYFIITFKQYMDEARKRELIEKELDIARDIQLSFLPGTLPEMAGLDVSVEMITAKQVGGDLYDIMDLGDSRAGIMIGDVSGKGFPAALYMAKATSIFKTYLIDSNPGSALKNTNDRLVSESSSGLFVTLSYMIFDTAQSEIFFSIGGHLPTLMIKPGGDVELLDVKEGLPLGMLESDFTEVKCGYQPGSIFVFYTDGVTEAMNSRGEMFSMERLIDLCGSLSGKTAADVVLAVQTAVLDFAGKASQHDDITVMAVRTK